MMSRTALCTTRSLTVGMPRGRYFPGFPVDAGRAFPDVGGDATPGAPEVAWICDPVPHVPVRFVGVALAPLVEFPLNVEEPAFISLATGVHRPVSSFVGTLHLPAAL